MDVYHKVLLALTIIFLVATIALAIALGLTSTGCDCKTVQENVLIIDGGASCNSGKAPAASKNGPGLGSSRATMPLLGGMIDKAKAASWLNGQNDLPTTIIVMSEQCGACHALRRTLTSIVNDGSLKNVNVGLLPYSVMGELSQTFKVSGVPHMFRVNGGKIVKELVGNVPAQTLRDFLMS